ncbi:hypothetical protein ACLOJK_034451, partial [Asimina triloba]
MRAFHEMRPPVFRGERDYRVHAHPEPLTASSIAGTLALQHAHPEPLTASSTAGTLA